METEKEETYPEQIPTEAFVEFRISDFPMKHEELTQLLGIQPTVAVNVGDKIQIPNPKKTVLSAGWSSWDLHSNIGEQKPIQEHIKYLYDIISPKKEIIKAICKEPVNLSLQILLYKDPKWREFFIIDPQIVKELGEMNVSISVNIYSLTTS